MKRVPRNESCRGCLLRTFYNEKCHAVRQRKAGDRPCPGWRGLAPRRIPLRYRSDHAPKRSRTRQNKVDGHRQLTCESCEDREEPRLESVLRYDVRLCGSINTSRAEAAAV